MYKIAIVDDDVEVTQRLAAYCQQFAAEEGIELSVQQFNSSEVFLEFYQEQTAYDLLLLDIEMGEMTGMEAAQVIRQYDQDVTIIFVTNMIQYAIQGYAVDALDFVVKPVDYDAIYFRLKRTFYQKQRQREESMSINTIAGELQVSVQDLLFVEVRGHQLYYHTVDKVYQGRGSMKAVEATLSNRYFAKPHQSFLVNLGKIDRISGLTIEIGEQEVPISRVRQREFLTAFSNFAGGMC